MNKNLEFEDVDAGVWIAILEKYKELDQISREKYGFGWKIDGFLPYTSRGCAKTHIVFVPKWDEIDRNFGKIPHLRELVNKFSFERLLEKIDFE